MFSAYSIIHLGSYKFTFLYDSIHIKPEHVWEWFGLFSQKNSLSNSTHISQNDCFTIELDFAEHILTSKASLPMIIAACSAKYGGLQVQRGSIRGSSLIINVFLRKGGRTTKLDSTPYSDRFLFPLSRWISWHPYHYAPDVCKCQQLWPEDRNHRLIFSSCLSFTFTMN